MSENDHILFSAGGINLAVDSTSIHCVHDSLIAQSEDGTSDWFLGVAVADERLIPISDLGVYLQGTCAADRVTDDRLISGRVLEVAKELGLAGLKIDAVHGVSRNPLAPVDVDVTDNDVSGDQPLQPMVLTDEGKQYRLIDLASLMQSSRFLNIELESA